MAERIDCDLIEFSHILSTTPPEPPACLSSECADVWRNVAREIDPSLFSETLLVQLCRHIVAANHTAQLIQRAESFNEIDVDEVDRLYRMQERQTSQICALRKIIK